MHINLLTRVKLFRVMRYIAVLKLIHLVVREILFRVMSYIAIYELSFLKISILE